MNFPPHKAALFLTHNEHKNYYATVEQECENKASGYEPDCWVSATQKQKAVRTDDCWSLQWYPNTPIGFRLLRAADLDVLLEAARKEDH